MNFNVLSPKIIKGVYKTFKKLQFFWYTPNFMKIGVQVL